MTGRENKRVEATITGRVQGVSYRWYTLRQASSLGLTGWVRNRPDGAVELVAEGPRASIEALLGWCADGPPMARVDQVSPNWSEPTGAFTDFTIRH